MWKLFEISMALYGLLYCLLAGAFVFTMFSKLVCYFLGRQSKRPTWMLAIWIGGFSTLAGLFWRAPDGLVTTFGYLFFLFGNMAPIYYWFLAFRKRALLSRKMVLIFLLPMFLFSGIIAIQGILAFVFLPLVYLFG